MNIVEQFARMMPVECSIDVVVIRANGYREDLGRVGYWNRSWLKRMEHKLRRLTWRALSGAYGVGLVAFVPHREPGLLWAVPTLSLLPFFLATLQTNAGQAIVTNRIHGGGTEPLQQGWGTGAGAMSATSTTLSTETATDLSTTSGTRTAGTGSQVTGTNTNDTYQVTATRSATGGGTVTNAGLFDNNTIGSGNLYMGGDGLSITLANGDSIAFTDKVRYS